MVSATLIHGKVVELMLEGVSKCSENRMGTGSSQKGFTKWGSSLTNQILFYSEIVSKQGGSSGDNPF